MLVDEVIPVFKPALGEEEIQAATKSLQLGWLGPGSFVENLKKE